MARVRENREVYNTSDKEYKEEFRGETLVFAPNGGSHILERRAAVEFMGQYVPFDREKSMGEKPLSWRPAKGKVPAAALPEVEIDEPAYVNPANGKKFNTKDELDEDLKGFAHLTLKVKED